MSKKSGGDDAMASVLTRMKRLNTSVKGLFQFRRMELFSLGEKNGKKNEEADGDNSSKDEP